jgi:alpha-L-rhamnosidase
MIFWFWNVVFDKCLISRFKFEIETAGFILDFGENFAGFLEVLWCPVGATLMLRYGELLWPNGTLNWFTAAAGQLRKAGEGGPCSPSGCQTDAVHCNGGAFVNAFTRHAFRYAELTGWPAGRTGRCSVATPCRLR